MGLMEIRRKILTDKSNYIPSTYQRTDYLQAQGDTAVIDSGVPGNDDTLKFNICFNVDRETSYRGFFNNYSSETDNVWRLSMSPAGAAAYDMICGMNTRTNSAASVNTGDTYIGKKTFVTVSKTEFTATVDGNVYTGSIATAEGTANNATIYINTSRRAARTNTDVIKWYYFKIYSQGKLIRNYIPCYRKSDNKGGFYDTVNQTFNPSTGTTDFTAGNDT